MIAQISGKVVSIGERQAVIDVNGLGYRIYAPNDTLSTLVLGEHITLITHLVVREDTLDLYGFSSARERDFFGLLIGISGIGPKAALGILNLAPIQTLEGAIISGDSGYLTKVSGIGKKTAEKLVLELRDKITASKDRSSEEEESEGYHETSDAIDALQSLGYTPREARAALGEIPNEITNLNEKIREALKVLGRSR